jgi:hypothetical protein
METQNGASKITCEIDDKNQIEKQFISSCISANSWWTRSKNHRGRAIWTANSRVFWSIDSRAIPVSPCNDPHKNRNCTSLLWWGDLIETGIVGGALCSGGRPTLMQPWATWRARREQRSLASGRRDKDQNKSEWNQRLAAQTAQKNTRSANCTRRSTKKSRRKNRLRVTLLVARVS